MSPCADGQKFTAHKDQKSPSQAFCCNADGRGAGVKSRENLPMSEMDGPLFRILLCMRIKMLFKLPEPFPLICFGEIWHF